MSAPPLDTKTCPLCGGPNGCGMAEGRDECWCFNATIAQGVLERLPDTVRGKVCVCARCASGDVRAKRVFVTTS